MPQQKQQKPVTRKRGRGGHGGASSRSGRTPARRRYIQDMAEESSDEGHSSSSSDSSSSDDSRYDSSFVDDDGSDCELEDATFYRLLDLAQSQVRAAEGPTVPVHVTTVPPSTSSLLDDILGEETTFSPNEAGPEPVTDVTNNGPAQAGSSAPSSAPPRRGPGRPPGARNRNPTAASRRRNENATPASPPSTATPGNRGGRSRGAASTFFESPIPGEEYLPRASAPAYNIPLLKIQPDEVDEVTNSFWPGDEVT
jgi:hypothetical protein